MTTPRDNDALQIRKWAATGDVATPESVGIDRAEGWDIQYSTPGGNLPEREVINQVLREISSLGDEVNRHGCGLPWDDRHGCGLPWDERIDYLHPALVTGSDGNLYVSVQDSTNQDPTADTNNTNWLAVSAAVSPAAGETAAGLVELATLAEIRNGTPGALAVTAERLHDFLAVDVQVFTASGTWTKPAGAQTAYVQVWGGGGGGAYQDSNYFNVRGGGGGGYGEATWAASALPNSVAVTIGAGGGFSGNDGTAGGDSSFNGVLGRGGDPGIRGRGDHRIEGGLGDSRIDSDLNMQRIPIFTGGYGFGSYPSLVSYHSTYGGGGGGENVTGVISDGTNGGQSLFGGNGAYPSVAQIPGGGGAAMSNSSLRRGARGEVKVYTYYHDFTGRPKYLAPILS